MKLQYIIGRLISLTLLFTTAVVSVHSVNIKVALVHERSAIIDIPFTINRSIGILEIAMKKSREIVQETVNLNFVIRPADTKGCTALKFGALVAELYHKDKIDAVIGPGCSNAVEIVARLAAAWNIPHITYGGTSKALGNKTEFRTLTRLAYTMDSFSKFYIHVFNAFSWTDIANIYDSTTFLYSMVANSIQYSFLEAGVNSHKMSFKSSVADERTEFLRVLNEAKKVSRVFLLSCHGNVLRKFALFARQVGMRPEEYTIIYFVSDPTSGNIGNYGWERGDEFDLEAKKAYESVMVVIPRRPFSEEFLEFERTAFDLAWTLYGYKWAEGSELGILQSAQYDAIILYAYAVRESMEAGEDPKDASLLNKRMWHRIFSSIGGKVYINRNGDRDTDCSLMDLEPIHGKFRMVAQYLGYTGTFELLSDVPVHWPNDAGPTLNRPKCGFVGELCITYSFPVYGSVVIGFAAVIIVIIIAGTLIFRRIRAETAIQSHWWRVKWEELSTQTKSQIMSSRSSKQGESETQSAATNFAGYKTIGIYQGIRVHVRKLKIKSITVDRKLLLELKEMRDVTCPNLTRLIGLCPETNNVCMITEHCSRGSLQDILQNESIQLSKEFRLSLINDIVQGLHYIHTSPIEVHGKLTSSTCVIDGRFVLKITGFGLRSINDSFMDTPHQTEDNTNTTDPELLWMAPEHLRKYPQRTWSQPGDIYSFGIILYEMCTRYEPYVNESWYQSVEDTIKQIKTDRPKPRRPSFGSSNTYPELYKLAIDCWRENPADRPTVSGVKKQIQFLRRGNPHGSNVLDMLLHRMEQYANNLEGLVEEKTQALLEEKKRTEALLYQVLPKSVADQLKVGNAVVPEAFESVTIYFSDIVGFTTISAASSPLQVVDFLNDVYICFDEIIANFDVYKVETIGDAYMVVSGLPVRNENEHVRQISRMSLKILEQVKQFVIQHQPDTPLRARIGIHSGPVVAGVVGQKMPRYCLFGDTVNTASSMESNGQPMMIHISDSTRQLLEQFGNFVIEERGFIEIKGKGVMLTHWLVEEVILENIVT